MNHRVEIWSLFIILIDWIIKLWISYQPELLICVWIINSAPVQFIWFAKYNLVLGVSDLYSFVVFQRWG